MYVVKYLTIISTNEAVKKNTRNKFRSSNTTNNFQLFLLHFTLNYNTLVKIKLLISLTKTCLNLVSIPYLINMNRF